MIQGKKVTLKMASTADRPLIYEMALSTDYMRQCFEEDRATFASFEEGYEDRYFDNRDPSVCGGVLIYAGGLPVGFISYGNISFGHKGWIKPGIVEFDMWMYGEHNCGKGLGTDAVVTLADHLHQEYSIHTFFMCPGKTNARAIRAYEKAGFTQVSVQEKQDVLHRVFTSECLRSLEPDCEYISEKSIFMLKEYRKALP